MEYHQQSDVCSCPKRGSKIQRSKIVKKHHGPNMAHQPFGGHFTSFQIGLLIDTVQDPSGFTMVICPILFMKHTSNSTRRNLKTRNSGSSSISLWLNYSNSPTFSYHTASYHRMIPLTFTIIPVTENDDFGHDQIPPKSR